MPVSDREKASRISGVMGAYLVLYPRVRVFALVPLGFFLTSVALPAWMMLLYWIGLQVLSDPDSLDVRTLAREADLIRGLGRPVYTRLEDVPAP